MSNSSVVFHLNVLYLVESIIHIEPPCSLLSMLTTPNLHFQ